MEVYEFEKNLLTRLNESRGVLQCKESAVPASQVRAEWAYHIELQIEPAGWTALWNIPRVICAELSIKHPTIVHVEVDQVYFRDLKAVVRIISVQDDDIDIGNLQEVSLVELWPTVQQENPSLNIDVTADCIDQLRFFYNHLWMPWDDDADDNCDWAGKHLESRIRFCYDLRRKAMKRSVAAHVRNLLIEARYIQKRREYLEIEVGDDDEDEMELTGNVAELTRLHLRLAKIRPEIELLENPKMRKLMELAENGKSSSSPDKPAKLGIFVVMLKTTMGKQIEFLGQVQNRIGGEKEIQTSKSLQDALDHSEPSDEIYIPPGKHSIEFLEYLNENGKIEALATTMATPDADVLTPKTNSIICTRDDESILLVFDGDFNIRNVTLDCRNVRTGILIRSGKVKFDNCFFIGSDASSTQQGLVVLGDANVELNNCVTKYFATALSVFDESTVTLNDTMITSAKTGIDMSSDARLHLNSARIVDCKHYGLAMDTFNMDSKERKVICKDVADMADVVNGLHVVAVKSAFEHNEKGNILLVNKRKDLFKFDRLMDDLDNIYGKVAKLDDSADIPVGINDSSVMFLSEEEDDDDDDYDYDETEESYGALNESSVIVID